MQTFLSTFTWDLIVYTTASFFHSFFLIFGGSFAAVWILLKIQTLQTTYTSDLSLVPVSYGWNYLLFGVIVGTVNYLAGNVAKNIVDNVLLSIGFRDHSYSNDTQNLATNVAIVGPEGITTTQTTETYPNSVVDFDYAALIQMQDSWSNFFGLQRFTQLIAPYLLLAAVESGVVASWILLVIFTNIA